jgi:hypothetical protein
MMRKPLAALVSLGLLGWACGCQKQVRLVENPPPPYFGPRTVATLTLPPSPVYRPAPAPAPAPAPSAGRASWGEAAWIPGGAERPWQFIVVHHSATPTGSADQFDRMHRAKGWDELGYHFVIGNGTLSGNGEVEVGSRWVKQKHGAHAKVAGHPEYNDLGIGICLVGNFDITRPSEAQMDSLARLVRCMMNRYGISRSHIYGHGQLKPTDCPGRNFIYSDLFRRL